MRFQPLTRSSLMRLLLPALGFLMINLIAAYFSIDFLKGMNIDVWNTSPDILKGPGDNYSYVIIMRAFLNHDFGNYHLHYWAPGFPLLIAFIIGLTGEAHYFTKVLLLDVVFWTASFTCIYHWLSVPKNPWLRFVMISSIWLLPNFRWWSLGYGYLLSESTSHALVLAGLVLLGKSILDGRTKNIYLAVFILGLAANFRAVLDFSFSFTSYIMFAVFLLMLLYSWIIRKESERYLSFLAYLKSSFTTTPLTRDRAGFKIFIVSFLILNGMTLPWKAINFKHCKQYAFSCGGAGLEWTVFHWSKEEAYPDAFKGWLHGGDPACSADPKLCEIIQANHPQIDPWLLQFSILTLIRHPFKWMAYKLENFNWIWVNLAWGNWLDNWSHWLEGLFYLVAGAIGFTLFLRPSLSKTTDSRNRALSLSFIGLALIVSYCGIFSFLHYEDRYSLTLRLFFLVLFYFGITRKSYEMDNQKALGDT